MIAPARKVKLAGTLLVAMVAGWTVVRLVTLRHESAPLRPAAAARKIDADPGDVFGDDGLNALALTPLPAKIPDRLPAFVLRNLAGAPTSIATWHDQALMINFWATWCAPCRREIPLLQALSGEWRQKGLTVIGIAVDDPQKVQAYAASMRIGYPLLVGDQDALDVAARFGVMTPVFPFTVFTDRNGDVVALYMGALKRPQADLILAVVRMLDDGQIKAPEARRSIAAGLHALGQSSG